MDHLFEGKYLSPFKSDNPRIVGRLQELKKAFEEADGVNPKIAKKIWQSAVILHHEFMRCVFCGQTNTFEHAEGCPLYFGGEEDLTPDVLLKKLYDWNRGFTSSEARSVRHFFYPKSFLLGLSRQAAKRISEGEGTDFLHQGGNL